MSADCEERGDTEEEQVKYPLATLQKHTVIEMIEKGDSSVFLLSSSVDGFEQIGFEATDEAGVVKQSVTQFIKCTVCEEILSGGKDGTVAGGHISRHLNTKKHQLCLNKKDYQIPSVSADLEERDDIEDQRTNYPQANIPKHVIAGMIEKGDSSIFLMKSINVGFEQIGIQASDDAGVVNRHLTQFLKCTVCEEVLTGGHDGAVTGGHINRHLKTKKHQIRNGHQVPNVTGHLAERLVVNEEPTEYPLAIIQKRDLIALMEKRDGSVFLLSSNQEGFAPIGIETFDDAGVVRQHITEFLICSLCEEVLSGGRGANIAGGHINRHLNTKKHRLFLERKRNQATDKSVDCEERNNPEDQQMNPVAAFSKHDVVRLLETGDSSVFLLEKNIDGFAPICIETFDDVGNIKQHITQFLKCTVCQEVLSGGQGGGHIGRHLNTKKHRLGLHKY